MMSPERRIRRAAGLSLAYNVVQTAVKLGAALLTGSVAILVEAFHSGTDLASALVSFIALRFALRPPDEDHPYGHGKIDSLAGFAEAVLLLAFSTFVVATSIVRLFQPAPLVQAGIGAWLVGSTAIGAAVASVYIGREAKATGSATLRSNSQHLRVDAFTSTGVLLGVLAAGKLQAPWLDSAVALALAGFLGFEAMKLARRAFGEVVDERIERDELVKIEAVLQLDPDLLGWHRIRTRHSGREHLVDLHIVLPDEMTVAQGHRVADRVEKAIEARLAPAHCVVHVDPLSDADHED